MIEVSQPAIDAEAKWPLGPGSQPTIDRCATHLVWSPGGAMEAAFANGFQGWSFCCKCISG